MKQQVLKHFDVTWLPLTALILFVVCFSLYAWWTYKKANKSHFEGVALVPLNDPTPTTIKGRGL
jgi:cbb3-type cytochrome oxidase subunit 3